MSAVRSAWNRPVGLCNAGHEGIQMARVVVFYRTPKDIAAFDEHYFETHVALAKMLPGLRKHEIRQGLQAIQDSALHLVATFRFDSADAASWALASPEGKALGADRRRFVPNDNDVLMFLIDSDDFAIDSHGM